MHQLPTQLRLWDQVVGDGVKGVVGDGVVRCLEGEGASLLIVELAEYDALQRGVERRRHEGWRESLSHPGPAERNLPQRLLSTSRKIIETLMLRVNVGSDDDDDPLLPHSNGSGDFNASIGVYARVRPGPGGSSPTLW